MQSVSGCYTARYLSKRLPHGYRFISQPSLAEAAGGHLGTARLGGRKCEKNSAMLNTRSTISVEINRYCMSQLNQVSTSHGKKSKDERALEAC